MKVINTKKKFAGFVSVLGEKIYIDVSNGTGFYEVLTLMEPYVNKLLHFGVLICPLNSEDIKQNIYVLIIEGLSKYNPEKGASLSTFLYKYIQNKIIDYSRKKDPLKNPINYDGLYEVNIEEKLDIMKKIKKLDEKWRVVVFRIFINGDKIAEISKDINMTPWGLTRALRRKLAEI